MRKVNTTVSTTPCLTSWAPERPQRVAGRGWAWLLWGLLTWMTACQPVFAEGNEGDVVDLRVEQSDNGLYLSVGVPFELPTPIEDALYKGIAMHFIAQVEVLRERWYWYDKPVVSVSRNFRLSFQPLTRRWRLQVVSEGPSLTLSQTFDTLPETLSALQRIARWRIADSADFDPTARHNLAFVFRLDVGKLPRPFQIGTLGQKDWSLEVRRTQRLVVEPAR